MATSTHIAAPLVAVQLNLNRVLSTKKWKRKRQKERGVKRQRERESKGEKSRDGDERAWREKI